MSAITTELANKLVSKTGEIDTNNLYIDVEKVDNDHISVKYKYKGEKVSSASLMNAMFSGPSREQKKGSKIAGEVYATLATSEKGKKNAKGPCNNAYIVEWAVVSVAGGGWGRLLYYVAMHFAGKNGITADRIKSSSSAVEVWNKLWSDADVEKLPLDDFFDPKTPNLNDDCNLASSGVYGEKPTDEEKGADSAEAHDWNPSLRGDKDTEKLSPEEKAKRAKQYKEIKASKLNYVYRGESKEAINILANAGMLAINGQFPKKQTVVANRSVPAPKPLEEQVSLYGILFGD
jgi:hypothetical protein